jgi:hypothetical protein
MLDANSDGQVTPVEYDVNKIQVIYRNAPPTMNLAAQEVAFSDTKISRQYFDSIDKDRNGTLSPIELLEALKFENLDTSRKGFLELEDVRRFMNRIGR